MQKRKKSVESRLDRVIIATGADKKVTDFEFPVGYYKFHGRQLFNFQMNRWFSLGYSRAEDLIAAGQQIRSFKDWKTEMLKLAELSVRENRLMNAAFYNRAAEFYLKSNDPDKGILYNRFIELFYKAFESENIERHTVPYGEAFLPVVRVSIGSANKGTILVHGGFDSFIEEWFSMMKYFANRGYEVIGFEGPGQGAALRKYGLPLTFEWEKPTKTILDYFNLSNCTMIGMSMGGWFCLRAAAFEPRLKRVIASGHAIDYMKCMNPFFRGIHLWFFEHFRGFMNRMAILKFDNREGMAPWVVDHLKYITQKKEPMDALEIYIMMNEHNIHSERVKQDVLILSGNRDHFIPLKMHGMQMKALTNARSVTGRIFTEKDHAQNHCQTGNTRLALEVMAKWIDDHSCNPSLPDMTQT